MNERIKELSDIAYKNHLKNNPHSSFAPRSDYDKEFAELIVKECAEIARLNTRVDSKVYLMIKKHFGVE